MAAQFLTNSQYHNHPAIGSTFAKNVVKETLYHALSKLNDFKETDAMKLGSALHCLIGEPEEFSRQFAIALNREQFPDAVNTVEEIKGRIQDLTKARINALEKDYKNIASNKNELLKKEKSEILKINTDCQTRIDNIDESSFSTKKAMNTKIAAIKKQYVAKRNEVKIKFKYKKQSYKEQLTQKKKKISEQKSFRSGARAALIENLRMLDPKILVWSEIKATFERDNKDKTIITAEMAIHATGMKEAIMNHPTARGIISKSRSENSYFSYDKETGLEKKCRPDLEIPLVALVDIKTTRCAAIEKFRWECLDRGYHIQAPWYLDVYNDANGTEIKRFIFIAVENLPPYAVSVMEMGEEEIKLGREESNKALKEYKDFLDNKDSVPAEKYGYGNEIKVIKFGESVLAKRRSA